MILEPTTVARLVFIRQLSLKGKDESRQASPMSAAAILTLHDAVELFFVLAADEKGVQVKTNTPFMANFIPINQKIAPAQLEHKSSIARLNKIRTALKHSGILPAQEEIERACSGVVDFFEDNTPLIFNVDFSSISLVDLVMNDRAKQFLQKAKIYIADVDSEKAIIAITRAEKILWRGLEDQNMDYLPGRLSFSVDRDLEEILELAFKSIRQLDFVVLRLAYGIDPFRSKRFNLLVPHVFALLDSDETCHVQWYGGKKPPSLDDCRWCLDFVVDVAIRMQRAMAIDS